MEFPQRKHLRLEHFDYASHNCYFVTICTNRKQKFFGMTPQLSILGKIAADDLNDIPLHYLGVQIEKAVVMPNHIHAILSIDQTSTSQVPSLSTIIGQYKSGVSRKIHAEFPTLSVWQTSFYDRIIRNYEEYLEIWNYIDENPLKWNLDELYCP